MQRADPTRARAARSLARPSARPSRPLRLRRLRSRVLARVRARLLLRLGHARRWHHARRVHLRTLRLHLRTLRILCRAGVIAPEEVILVEEDVRRRRRRGCGVWWPRRIDRGDRSDRGAPLAALPGRISLELRLPRRRCRRRLHRRRCRHRSWWRLRRRPPEHATSCMQRVACNQRLRRRPPEQPIESAPILRPHCEHRSQQGRRWRRRHREGCAGHRRRIPLQAQQARG